ncbi:hypothetical protein ACLOJK_018776 [Asimina triloba]
MSTVLAFEFMLGGGFPLSNGRSFDLAIPHQFIHVLASMARRMYSYVNYSPTAITLVTEGNWPTLLTATASPAPLPSCKAASTVAASSAPLPSRKAALTVVVTASLAPLPSHKATSTVATSLVPRPSRKAAFTATA